MILISKCFLILVLVKQSSTVWDRVVQNFEYINVTQEFPFYECDWFLFIQVALKAKKKLQAHVKLLLTKTEKKHLKMK